MTNPFIEKAKKQEKNPFIAKAQTQNKRKGQQDKARANYEFLRKLLERYTDNDDPDARERIRARTQEAREALDSYS